MHALSGALRDTNLRREREMHGLFPDTPGVLMFALVIFDAMVRSSLPHVGLLPQEYDSL
jgi:hypothetical protein